MFILRSLFALLTVAYPLLVLFGLRWLTPGELGAVLAVFAVLRWSTTRDPLWRACALCALLLAGLTAWQGDGAFLKLYPVLVNAAFLLAFAFSLRYPPTIIERIARVCEPQLDVIGQHYTRRVTQVWCVFFLCNGSIAWLAAHYAPASWWAWYTGVIAYGLSGALFIGERLTRAWWRARLQAMHLSSFKGLDDAAH
jgi:uncharacterized membrane protein